MLLCRGLSAVYASAVVVMSGAYILYICISTPTIDFVNVVGTASHLDLLFETVF